MRRNALIAGAVLAVVLLAAGIFYWTRTPRAPLPAALSVEQQAADAWLALRIQIFAAGPQDDVLVRVTGYDRRARQAAIARDATGGRWRGSGGGASVEPRAMPAGWTSLLQLESNGGAVPFSIVRDNGDEAVLRIEASRLPAPGALLSARLTYEAGEAYSNTQVFALAADDAIDRSVALALQAELAGDTDRLMQVGVDLVAREPASAWGHYFAGVAHEARGDRDAAAAAFKQALARVTPGQEAPIDLVARIRRLGR